MKSGVINRSLCPVCRIPVSTSLLRYRPAQDHAMLTLTSIITRSVLAVATMGGLAVLADGAVRSQLEQAVRGDLAFLGHIPKR